MPKKKRKKKKRKQPHWRCKCKCDNKPCSQLHSYMADCQYCRGHAVLRWTIRVSQTKNSWSTTQVICTQKESFTPFNHGGQITLITAAGTSYQKANHPWVGRTRWRSLWCRHSMSCIASRVLGPRGGPWELG